MSANSRVENLGGAPKSSRIATLVKRHHPAPSMEVRAAKGCSDLLATAFQFIANSYTAFMTRLNWPESMNPFGYKKSASLPVYVSKSVFPGSHSSTNSKHPAFAQTPMLALEITDLDRSAAPR